MSWTPTAAWSRFQTIHESMEKIVDSWTGSQAPLGVVLWPWEPGVAIFYLCATHESSFPECLSHSPHKTLRDALESEEDSAKWHFLPAVRPNQMLSKNLTIWLEGNCHLAKRRVQSYLAQAWDNKLRIDSGSFVGNRFYCLKPGLDWTRLFMSLTAGAGTRCMSLLSSSPNLFFEQS